ncbi:hypothetical protein [Pseudomonas sp. GD03730]|uniref:hypothetical protein n=1 Tax=Pseudomonas sp. GD03730 TaxID=2975375 RepID=UPI002448EE91|nr:hypothetical protein [Pseudomonas sp. GD03730]MDH1403670.1 hypothetical protein [Pseudomonas sp. GD03730]
MKVLIDRDSGKEPRALVDQLAPEGQEFPLVVSLTHKNELPLVLPSSGINAPLAPNEPHQVKVKSFEQAWLLVTDLSDYAARAGSDDKEYAVVTGDASDQGDVVEQPAAVSTKAKASAAAQATPTAETPAKESVK